MAKMKLYILKGGGWFSDGDYCRVADHRHDNPDRRSYGRGFRLTKNNNKKENKMKIKMADCGNFEMGIYPVTQKQYEKVMGTNPSYFKGKKRPVECVSWYDAINFCNKLSELEGLTPAYTINGEEVTWNEEADGYRLPTEAEWEYAAKAGKDYLYSGSDNLDEVGWYWNNSDEQTHPVGEKKPNDFGIYDMSGNVWEWCWDEYKK